MARYGVWPCRGGTSPILRRRYALKTILPHTSAERSLDEGVGLRLILRSANTWSLLMRNCIRFTALGAALMAGSSLAHAQTIVTDQPVDMVIAQQPGVVVTRTGPGRHSAAPNCGNGAHRSIDHNATA